MKNLNPPAGRPLTLALAVLSLAACASVPNVGGTPTPKAAASYATADSFSAPASAWPTDGWWRAYGDAQLSSLIEVALEGTPTLAQAQSSHSPGSGKRRRRQIDNVAHTRIGWQRG